MSNEKALVTKSQGDKTVALISHEFKVPRAKKKKVLEEEDYEESIVKIIERDYYPDLPKLKAQSEYLEAKATNDTEKLRELHIKYGPKRGQQTPGGATTAQPSTDIYTTPASFETPTAEAKLNTPGPSSQHKSTTSETQDKHKNDEQTDHPKPNTDLRLDKFLSAHTSEDNESFVELMEESERKRKEKQAWLYVKQAEQQALEDKHMTLKSMEEQAALEGNPNKLETWTYKPANALMYNVEGAPLTAEEKIDLASKTKVINPTATRFTEDPFKRPAAPSNLPGAKISKGVPGRVDFDGREICPATPSVGGYNFVATPTPTPDSLGESPMMTWGEIEGTPFLLDASDKPLKPDTPGPTFMLKDEPKRDRIGRELAEKVAKQHRDKKSQAVERMKNRLNTPGLSRTERLAMLSPAAQKLAAARGISIATDKALKASYTPSPIHRPMTGGTTTPSHVSRSTRSSATRTPKTNDIKTPTNASHNVDLTDNLLNLPSKRKSKASDFF